MSSSRRGLAFLVDKDKLLVFCYLEISQNPITGINQSSDTLWSRVTTSYNKQLTNPLAERRTMKALQCRWSNISKATQKFSGFIHQVELRHQSGVSEMDILDQSKELYKLSGSAWKLDHVWSLLKDQEKFKSSKASLPAFVPKSGNVDSSQSDYSPTPNSAVPNSPGLFGFAINLDKDSPSGSSQRPMGMKKAKGKRKACDESSNALSTVVNYSERMMAMMEKTEVSRQHLIDIENKRNDLWALKEENKILRMNSMFVDELVRAYLIEEQQMIWRKRTASKDRSHGSNNPFGQFFSGTSPYESDFPPY